jgi:3-oxoacyl-[acyl-carrier protein] reductase
VRYTKSSKDYEEETMSTKTRTSKSSKHSTAKDKSSAPKMRLSGRTAIVTGAGQGIGQAIALALAQEGANVVACARSQAAINALVKNIGKRRGSALAIPADVTVADQIEMLVDRALKEYGNIDILINNAGGIPPEVFVPPDSFKIPFAIWEWPESLWERVQQTNVMSAYLCMKAVMPHMIKHGSGHIINAASVMGLISMPGGGGYSVAKYGIVGLTRTAAMDASTLRLDIRINAVAAGLINTPGQRRILATIVPESEFPPLDPPESVAAAVIYLLCDAPESLTGQTIDLFSFPLPQYQKADHQEIRTSVPEAPPRFFIA